MYLSQLVKSGCGLTVPIERFLRVRRLNDVEQLAAMSFVHVDRIHTILQGEIDPLEIIVDRDFLQVIKPIDLIAKEPEAGAKGNLLRDVEIADMQFQRNAKLVDRDAAEIFSRLRVRRDVDADPDRLILT